MQPSDDNQGTGSQARTPAYVGLPGASPAGSAMPGPSGQNASHIGRMEQSNLAELSHSVLNTPGQMSNFVRQRGFLDPNRLLHAPQFSAAPMHNQEGTNLSNTALAGMHLGGGAEMSSNTQVLWGTNINTNELQSKLKEFLTTFTVEPADDDMAMDGDEQFNLQPHYISLLKQIAETEEYVLDVDCEHIHQYNPLLYKQLEDYPTDVIPIFDLVALQVFKETNYNNINANGVDGIQESGMQDFDQNEQIIQVRPFNLTKKYQIRELDPSHIDKLITLKGIVIRTSDTVPEMKEACFRCSKCQKEEYKYLERGRITEPDVCPDCSGRQTFEMIHNFCMFSDKQHVKLQETPEAVPEGETPQTTGLCAYEDLVDYVKPGDRVEVVGIYRAQGQRVNSQMRTLKNIYRTYIDVIGYVKTDKKRYENDDNDNMNQQEPAQEVAEENGDCVDGEIQDQALNQEHEQPISLEKKRKFMELANSPQLYDLLIDAFAPSIWENHDVKKGILCQLFGGCSKDFGKYGGGRQRGEINILLCGDPSTAKSQLLTYVHKIAPRGIYTSGKGSSAVGLTVYVTKDPETKEIVLESGALVLSDRGICCIDEFDKMDDNTRVILHEAMEQQTVSVAKAGIIAQLNARTAILAAANPVKSKYDPKLSVVDNIKLPPSLLSRFDLIYLVLDKQNEAADRRLANHIVSLYSILPEGKEAADHGENVQSTELLRSNKIDRDFFAQYISYARKNCKPKLSDTVTMDLVQEYVKMRSLGNSKKTITATPRQLESMIRISEALAKMRLSDFVEKRDVEEAVRLIKHALQQSATDPTTGEINMDIITTGQTKTSAVRLKAITEFIKEIQSSFRDKVSQHGLRYGNLLDFINTKSREGKGVEGGVQEPEFRDALRTLEEENVISIFGNTRAPTIRFVQQD